MGDFLKKRFNMLELMTKKSSNKTPKKKKTPIILHFFQLEMGAPSTMLGRHGDHLFFFFFFLLLFQKFNIIILQFLLFFKKKEFTIKKIQNIPNFFH
jgi:hypothetical protein